MRRLPMRPSGTGLRWKGTEVEGERRRGRGWQLGVRQS